MALYNASATLQAPTDAAAAALATGVLHATLAKLVPGQIADSGAVQKAARSDGALTVSGRHPCNVTVACPRAVAQAVDARWVVLAKMSKIAAVWPAESLAPFELEAWRAISRLPEVLQAPGVPPKGGVAFEAQLAHFPRRCFGDSF